MELELKNSEGKVIGTLDFPVDSLKESLASLSSNGSSVSKADLEEALAPLGQVQERLREMEARLKELTAEEKVVWVGRVFDAMGLERYVEEGAKRGYLPSEGVEEDVDPAGPGDLEEEPGDIVFSLKDRSNESGWTYSEALKGYVKIQ
ncbi:hypothetical protein LCGC14_0987340 [marine sediment metagenome]|uniref:Uncharacterized protein n=1 Tax=marine sediment metagenome TaxID=412755 RepID=A0A0F9NTF4_9ZZZZ